MAVIKYPEYETNVLKGNSGALLSFDLVIDFSKFTATAGDVVKFAPAFPMSVKEVQYYKESGTPNFSGSLKVGNVEIVSGTFQSDDLTFIGKQTTGLGDLLFEFTSNSSSTDAKVVFRIIYEVA